MHLKKKRQKKVVALPLCALWARPWREKEGYEKIATLPQQAVIKQKRKCIQNQQRKCVDKCRRTATPRKRGTLAAIQHDRVFFQVGPP